MKIKIRKGGIRGEKEREEKSEQANPYLKKRGKKKKKETDKF